MRHSRKMGGYLVCWITEEVIMHLQTGNQFLGYRLAQISQNNHFTKKKKKNKLHLSTHRKSFKNYKKKKHFLVHFAEIKSPIQCFQLDLWSPFCNHNPPYSRSRTTAPHQQSVYGTHPRYHPHSLVRDASIGKSRTKHRTHL